MEDEKVENFNWVQARSECSIERVFQILSEIVDSDVKSANALGRRGVKFNCNTEASRKVIVVRERDMGGITEIGAVVIELAAQKITVSQGSGNRTPELRFVAVPSFSQEGDCRVEVENKPLKLWQVSHRALDDLFFAF